MKYDVKVNILGNENHFQIDALDDKDAKFKAVLESYFPFSLHGFKYEGNKHTVEDRGCVLTVKLAQ